MVRIDQIRDIDQLPTTPVETWRTVGHSPPHAGREIRIYEVRTVVVEVTGGYTPRTVTLHDSHDAALADADRVMARPDGRGLDQTWKQR